MIDPKEINGFCPESRLLQPETYPCLERPERNGAAVFNSACERLSLNWNFGSKLPNNKAKASFRTPNRIGSSAVDSAHIPPIPQQIAPLFLSKSGESGLNSPLSRYDHFYPADSWPLK